MVDEICILSRLRGSEISVSGRVGSVFQSFDAFSDGSYSNVDRWLVVCRSHLQMDRSENVIGYLCVHKCLKVQQGTYLAVIQNATNIGNDHVYKIVELYWFPDLLSL